MKEIVLWGIPKNETDRLYEVVLANNCRNSADIEKVKAAASKDGFHSFRVFILDLNEMPNFANRKLLNV